MVSRYSFQLFFAKIYSNSLGWLEMSTKSTQPIFYLYCKEAEYKGFLPNATFGSGKNSH